MKAQVYFDSEPTVRIFGSPDWTEALADLRLDDCTPKDADQSLHRLGLYRREKWQRREWGLEARIRIDARS